MLAACFQPLQINFVGTFLLSTATAQWIVLTPIPPLQFKEDYLQQSQKREEFDFNPHSLLAIFIKQLQQKSCSETTNHISNEQLNKLISLLPSKIRAPKWMLRLNLFTINIFSSPLTNFESNKFSILSSKYKPIKVTS